MIRQKFCEKWFGSLGTWYDITCIKQLPEDRIVKIELAHYTVCHHDAFDVSIVNKLSGLIDRKKFAFGDYLKSRQDKRPDYKGPMYVWENGSSFDWYIAVPAEIEELTSWVQSYVDEWRMPARSQ